MASYNCEAWIQAAIDSVLRQTVADLELLIVDDASSDGSRDVLAAQTDPRVCVLHNRHNLGFIRTLDRLVSESRGDLLGIVDCDDALAPTALERVIEVFESDPDCGLVYTQHLVCDAELRSRGPGGCRPIPAGRSNLHCDAVHHFKCFRRDAFERTDGWDPRAQGAEDKDLAYKLEEVASVRFVDEPLYLYRVHGANASLDPRGADIGYQSVALARYAAYLRRLRQPHVPNARALEIARDLLGAANTNRRLGRPREMARCVHRAGHALLAGARARITAARGGRGAMLGVQRPR
jgi:glycosyltransferase involved in cell wall biosynthesis